MVDAFRTDSLYVQDNTASTKIQNILSSLNEVLLISENKTCGTDSSYGETTKYATFWLGKFINKNIRNTALIIRKGCENMNVVAQIWFAVGSHAICYCCLNLRKMTSQAVLTGCSRKTAPGNWFCHLRNICKCVLKLNVLSGKSKAGRAVRSNYLNRQTEKC
jgi:hypothetical protein